MKKSKKLISFISAATLLASAMPVMYAAAETNTAYQHRLNDSAFIATYNRFLSNVKNSMNSIDTNRNNYFDFDDFQAIETAINSIYAERGFKGDAIPTRSVNGEYNGFTADQLDINKDTIISVTDYCSLLYTLQSDYDFDYNTTECYAIIKNCKKTDAKSLIVPSEIYVDGKIMPVMEIAPNAFSKCKSLTDIKIESFKLPQWIDKYNNPFDSEKVGKPAASSYMCIDGYAFNGCKKLTKISLPDNVVFTADAFNNSGLSSKVEDIDGVNYFKENSDRWFACGITNSNKAIKNGVFKLNDNAVAITTYLFYGDGNIKEFLYNKSKLNFIADYTFENCENLEKVNNNSYENLSADEKEFINRFVSVFNSTKFIIDATEAQINDIAAAIRKEIKCENVDVLNEDQQRAAVNALGRHVYSTTYYNDFDIYGGEKYNKDNYGIRAHQFKSNSFYVNTPYNVGDYSRRNIYSPNASFLTGTTECAGFSFTTSLVLDKLGIKNYNIGGHAHALNLVFIGTEKNGKWYQVDLSADGDRENELNDNGTRKYANKQAFLDSIKDKNFLGNPSQKYYGLACNTEFESYESSRGKKINISHDDMIFSTKDNDTVLVVNAYASDLLGKGFDCLKNDIKNGIVELESDYNWAEKDGAKYCYDNHFVPRKSQWVNEYYNRNVYLCSDGHMDENYYMIGDKVYYQDSAVIARDFELDGQLFYTDSEGRIIKNQWINQYYNKSAYARNDGHIDNDWYMIGNKVYHQDTLQTTPFEIDGIYYNVNEDGELISNN